MINIRYHIVSITAVFLALGIGVALGSTFLDRATVDVLERNIRSAENRIDETNAENARLNAEVDDARQRDEALIAVGGEQLLSDRLTEVPVLVVAAPGTEEQDASELTATLAGSGADVRGVLRLRDPMTFSGTELDASLAEELGLEDPTIAELRDATYDALREALARAGADATEPPAVPEPQPEDPIGEPGDGETTLPTGDQPEIVSSLLAREYVELQPGPGADADAPILEEPGYRYVFLGAPDLEAAQNEALVRLLGEGSDDPALPGPVVTATQADPVGEEQAEPTVVALVRASDQLAETYNTVDDLDWFAGLVATVFTIEQLGTVPPAHYGVADGADAVLPESP
jgi:hypothetical protein